MDFMKISLAKQRKYLDSRGFVGHRNASSGAVQGSGNRVTDRIARSGNLGGKHGQGRIFEDERTWHGTPDGIGRGLLGDA